MSDVLENDIARCVGLWLAEGDNKTISEITLTNNSPEIIILFHRTLNRIFSSKNTPRIYVYSADCGLKPSLPINAVHKYYTDARSSRPYFIWRWADRKLVKNWHTLVEELKQKQSSYRFVLQGFFAGEGNIKLAIGQGQRVLRISQKLPNVFLEKMLAYFKVGFKFYYGNRTYEIERRDNLIKLAKLDIASLHPVKKAKFHSVMKSYKARKRKNISYAVSGIVELFDNRVSSNGHDNTSACHNKFKKMNGVEEKRLKNLEDYVYYPKGYLKNQILTHLVEPYAANDLAIEFERSKNRITKVLTKLKTGGAIMNYRAGSIDYWIRKDAGIVIISKRKSDILKLLNMPKYTFEVSLALNVNWKAAFRRLKELERLNLVKMGDKKLWFKQQTEKRIVVI